MGVDRRRQFASSGRVGEWWNVSPLKPDATLGFDGLPDKWRDAIAVWFLREVQVRVRVVLFIYVRPSDLEWGTRIDRCGCGCTCHG